MLSPWQTYYNEIRALFGEDPQVTTSFDEAERVIELRVQDEGKADALAMILPFERDFGGVTVRTRIIPANAEPIGPEVVEAAFFGNPVFKELVVVDGPGVPSLSYAMFRKSVVQFWNDNLGDPHGNLTTLYQDIAEDVLDVPGVLFSTAEA